METSEGHQRQLLGPYLKDVFSYKKLSEQSFHLLNFKNSKWLQEVLSLRGTTGDKFLLVTA